MYVVATAGHVDHGKSALVKALTGMEPDRWQTERDRGMSIDLGFGWTALPSGATVAFVDVPGHERFVANALAGLGASSAVLLVVAADEGWMPQTDEHVAAAHALGLRHGVLAVTRCDLADATPALAQARRQLAATTLAEVPAVAVSARTGFGLPELRRQLDDVLATLPAPAWPATTRLWIDRVFTIRGAGTVATGTLQSGQVSVGQRVVVARTADRPVVRAMQCLGESVAHASAVARVAVNLRNLAVSQLRRGDALIEPGGWCVTSLIDVRHQGQGALPRELIIHCATMAVAASVRPLGVDTARLRSAEALPLHVGDRLVLREPGTRRICAATVLDPDPPKLRHRGGARHRAGLLAGHDGSPDGRAELRRRGIVSGALLTAIGVDPPGTALSGDWYVDPDLARELGEKLRRVVSEPIAGANASPGSGPDGVAVEVARQRLDLPDPRLVAALAPPDLEVRRGLLRRRVPPGQVPPWLGAVRARLAERPFATLGPLALAELGATAGRLRAAVDAGDLLLVGGGYLLPDALAAATAVLHGLAQPFTTSQARQAMGTSRRIAIGVLELLDARGVTTRLADDTRTLAPNDATTAPAPGQPRGGGRESNPPASPREAQRF